MLSVSNTCSTVKALVYLQECLLMCYKFSSLQFSVCEDFALIILHVKVVNVSSASKRRQCCNGLDIFCFICRCFTLLLARRNINAFIKRVYLAYFGVPLGDQDKDWAPRQVCTTCVETLRFWSSEKNPRQRRSSRPPNPQLGGAQANFGGPS